MPTPPDAAGVHYRNQQAIARNTTRKALGLWALIDPTRLVASWSAVLTRVFVEVSVGQIGAASQADRYVDAVLAEQGINPDRRATIAPKSYAGIASDGRNLETLLLEPVIAVKAALGKGTSTIDALQVGAGSLARIVGTQVADAGRTAVGTAIVTRDNATSWTRMLNPPSCSRCAVLAGKVYRWNEGFLRHPRCDCVHIPTSENVGDDLRTDTRLYFDSLTPADQAKYFTADGAQAIRDGADIGQVVNARRTASGLYQANGALATTEGVTKRGFAGSRLIHDGAGVEKVPGARYSSTSTPRLMPESIYASTDDRAEAVELLRKYGYLV